MFSNNTETSIYNLDSAPSFQSPRRKKSTLLGRENLTRSPNGPTSPISARGRSSLFRSSMSSRASLSPAVRGSSKSLPQSAPDMPVAPPLFDTVDASERSHRDFKSKMAKNMKESAYLEDYAEYETALGGMNNNSMSSGWSDDFLEETESNDDQDKPEGDRKEAQNPTNTQHPVEHLDDSSRPTAVTFLGCPLPVWCSKSPSWQRVSQGVAKYAPCFWLCCGTQTGDYTNRTVLARLSYLMICFTSVQVAVSIWLSVILLADMKRLDREAEQFVDVETNDIQPTFWNINGSVFSVGILGLIVLGTALWTIRIIRDIDLIGAIRYLWILSWIYPYEIFLVISLYDYHLVTEVWVKHWWNTPGMAWFRDRCCDEGTANTLCTVPILGGEDFQTEEEWCFHHFDTTNCTEIRDDAQQRLEKGLGIFYHCTAAWALSALILMLLMIHTLERIVTKPIVQKSRESNVPAWLTLPIVGCTVVGSVLRWSPSSVLSTEAGSDTSWVGLFFLVAAGLFLFAAMVGWFISEFSILNSKDKRNKLIAVMLFVLSMIMTVLLLLAIFAASIVYSSSLVESSIDASQRGQIACFIDSAKSCSRCDEEDRRCPEWSTEDVTKVVQTQLKQSATLAAIFLLYSTSALSFGLVLRKHISMYEIDYV